MAAGAATRQQGPGQCKFNASVGGEVGTCFPSLHRRAAYVCPVKWSRRGHVQGFA